MILISITIFCGILILIVLVKSFSFTPEIKNGISEIKRLNIGGVDQYVLIRGENINNPVLLFLHGGPGTTELIPFRLFHKRLEKYFTVVVWEQRGTGKSFSPDIPVESMTIDQFVSDARDLTDYLRRRFEKDKILVTGHSWGSALGLLTVSRYPDFYYAFVGSGQEVCPEESESLALQYLLEKNKDNLKATTLLNAINRPDPYLTMDDEGAWFEKIKIQRKWLVASGGELFNRSDYSLLFNSNTLTAPEYSLMDFINFGRGSIFSLKTMWPQVMKINFMTQIPKVNVPVYFLQGRHDFNTSSVLVEKYFNSLSAPSKQLVWFEKSGHHPMYEEPDKYDDYLINTIFPMCK
ncbi:MAG: alpha/beta hydrolase [Spirochaetes bacterium]|nr:alpha/beta hydrolase [Spirochaetota bacterium]